MQISHFAKTRRFAPSWADSSPFPLVVLAGGSAGPPQGQDRLEFANVVGGHDGEGMKEA